MTTPGIPNDFVLSTSCFGNRLQRIEDQIFAAVAMGFRRIELGLCDSPPEMDGLEDSRRETGISIDSLVAGCRDPVNGDMAASRLGSLISEERERAMNSVRRHVRLAKVWGCSTVLVSGGRLEDEALRHECAEVEARASRDGLTEELVAEYQEVAKRVKKAAQPQIEHLCRSLHTLMGEAPEMVFALRPGMHLDHLLGFESTGWVLEDLPGLRYWHDVGRAHVHEKHGLGDHGQWLENYGNNMAGVHLQDAASEPELPIGLGEVDFQLVSSYLPKDAERVLELNPRHGRAEILSSVQFLVDNGF